MIDDIDSILQEMSVNARENPDVMYVSKRTYWACVYAQQGKCYPKERKRKSKMRMSKKRHE